MEDRRHSLVDRSVFRLKTIRVLVGLLIAFIVILIIIYLLMLYWIPAGEAIFMQNSSAGSLLNKVIVVEKILVALILVLAILIVWSIYTLGSRFLAPIKRLTDDIDSLSEKEKLESIRLRKKDEWELHSLTSALNDLIKELKSYREIFEDFKELRKKVEKGEISQKEVISYLKQIEDEADKSERSY